MKIARMSVKPIQKMLNLFKKMLIMFKKMLIIVKKMLNMSKKAAQSKWDNVTTWVYSTCTQVLKSMIYHV